MMRFDEVIGWAQELRAQAECLVAHGRLSEPLEEVQASIEQSRRSQLY